MEAVSGDSLSPGGAGSGDRYCNAGIIGSATVLARCGVRVRLRRGTITVERLPDGAGQRVQARGTFRQEGEVPAILFFDAGDERGGRADGFDAAEFIGGARIAAVGPATATKLKELHLQVDLMPEEAIGSAVAAAFKGFESIENLKICLLRAEVANRELPEALEAMGAIVDDVACYQTVPETEDATGAAASLLEQGADWVAFTSGSTVAHFHARFDLPALLSKFPQLKTATIGPETSKALAVLG